MPHSRHIGTIRMIAVESAKLSYSAECVSHTNSTHSGKMNSAVLPAAFFLERQLRPFEARSPAAGSAGRAPP